MRDIDVILLDSCSGHLIYIRKFQFQWNLRWSIFRPYYCEIWTLKWLWWVSVQDTDKILVPFFKFHQTIKCISFTDWNSNIDQITLTLNLLMESQWRNGLMGGFLKQMLKLENIKEWISIQQNTSITTTWIRNVILKNLSMSALDGTLYIRISLAPIPVSLWHYPWS